MTSPNPEHMSIAEHLGRTARLWRRVANSELEPLGLSYPRWSALWMLRRLGDGISQSELALALEIELGSLMRTLKHLEAQGLITRRCSPEDKRTRTVHVTDSGSELMSSIEVRVLRVRKHLLSGIAAEDFDALERVLVTINQNAMDYTATTADDHGTE
ncbi:MarR family winged helix-turn-helix transcriptional regulator [Salinivibrio kushneri]|uniref:MarR family winged helix-turn-helix transcriptional regulator n=1 Tax=Salinivibrio kushneri TaxID=1908198 RepID=UPI0009889C01|nr:MarR family transcriptional regulator [Salinivibrio kushneri]OOE48151.1 MarR family transcriptional regulator [Salinivibrio kushneri]OOE48513.1 MarR family transcriptional regulator [Salinivibrio kushneri]